jgi:hypothetical protein
MWTSPLDTLVEFSFFSPSLVTAADPTDGLWKFFVTATFRPSLPEAACGESTSVQP